MIYEQAARLTEIVRKDDVKAFGEIASPELFASAFGRFPLLSLLYLFSARRIVKKYLSDLIGERSRTRYDRIPEADALFMKKAGKALRHYTDREVSPLEMLAILGRGRELKALFRVYPAADRYLNAIHAVYYTRVGEGIVRKGDTLLLPKEPLGYYQKKLLFIASIVMVCLFALTLSLSLAVPLYYGFGTEGRPYNIYGEKEFAAHYAETGVVSSLQCDLTLTKTAETVSGEILGNDKIIRLTAPFADTFTGILRDVTFVLEEGYPAAAVIRNNRGKLKNVSVVTANAAYDKTSFTETLSDPVTDVNGEPIITQIFSLLTTYNQGNIESCTAVVTLSFTGKEGGNAYFAPFAAENHGTIRACRAEGSVSSVAVDMAGIVAVNHSDGAVLDCGSAMTITQRTTIEAWNPNVAGIASENAGTISSSANSGALTSSIELSALGENVSAAGAYVAGIANKNTGNIFDCTNDGEILARGEYGNAFASGIVSRNEPSEMADTGVLRRNVSRGQVSAYSTTHDAYAAGIAVENYVSIEDSVNHAEILAEASLASGAECFVFAAGIATLNCGAVIGASDYGTITANGANAYAFAGGIVARNTYTNSGVYFGAVTGCSSYATVSATSESFIVYAGGIAASNDQNCTIYACRQMADVRAEASEEAADRTAVFAAVGGICGYTIGSISSSFYFGTLPTGGENRYAGGICGMAYVFRYFYDYIPLSSNAFVEGEEEGFAAGALVFNGSILRPVDLTEETGRTLLDYGTISASSAEEIELLDIYKGVAEYYE